MNGFSGHVGNAGVLQNRIDRDAPGELLTCLTIENFIGSSCVLRAFPEVFIL
jgi:hypothetical protein